MWIQVLLLVAIAGVTLLLTRSTAGARHQAVRRLLLGALVLAAVLSVLFPSGLTAVARTLGVGRGADLLLYGLIIAFLGSVATTYRRMAEMDRKLTVLARQLALTQAAPAGDPGPSGQHSAPEAEPGTDRGAPGR